MAYRQFVFKGTLKTIAFTQEVPSNVTIGLEATAFEGTFFNSTERTRNDVAKPDEKREATITLEFDA